MPAPELLPSKQLCEPELHLPREQQGDSSKVTAAATAQRRIRGDPADMKGPVPTQDAMASDTEPSNTIKLLHLLFLSTSWGMQVWVTFVAGRLGCAVPCAQGGGTGEGALPQD